MASTDESPTTPHSPISNKSQNARPPRPKIVLPTPQVNIQPNPMYTANIPITPNNPQQFPFHMYPTKAGEFMFKQFSGFKDFTYNTAKSGMSCGEKIAFWLYNKVSFLSKRWFTHIFLFLVILLYSVGGAFLFVTIEGRHEEIVLKSVYNDRMKLLQTLKEISNEPPEITTDEEIKGKSYRALLEYEEILADYWSTEALVLKTNRDNGTLWSLWNAAFYCATIYTTIGYGHMYPTTTTGKALTIVYAIIGIPLFLIILTDFGKLFTRAIKFLWAFVRRLYYTGTCKKARKVTAVQEVMKGAQMMYEIATFRRPSQFNLDEEAAPNGPPQFPAVVHTPHSQMEPPDTPAPSTYEIDDEFNLPISVAIFLLIAYIFIGAIIYYVMEDDWGFFTSFYFVFISMSTIGFGDYVPSNPICMVISIIYLVFGLALMSMCINVVQLKLSDTFKQASAKLGATIGLTVAEEDGSITTIPPPTIEIAEVHQPNKST